MSYLLGCLNATMSYLVKLIYHKKLSTISAHKFYVFVLDQSAVNGNQAMNFEIQMLINMAESLRAHRSILDEIVPVPYAHTRSIPLICFDISKRTTTFPAYYE